MKPYWKVAVILFVMYMHLLLIAAIAVRKQDSKSHAPAPFISGNPASVISGVPSNLNESPEPEPENTIEDWMLDMDYLTR